MKQEQKRNQKKETTPIVCCPYFDKDAKACSHPQCIRLLGLECMYKNKKIK